MNDFKWFAIICCVGIISMSTLVALDSYYETQIKQLAFQNGYIQKIDKETYRTIWVKAEHE